MIRLLVNVLSLFSFSVAFSQLPNSQLFVLDLNSIRDTHWTLHKISYLTAFNESSYNNQPFFATDKILLASLKRIDTEATDIYRFDLSNKTLENLTQSPDHEYSPRLSPVNHSLLTYVQVSHDDSTAQNLVEQNLVAVNSKKYIFENFAKIGYYRAYKDQGYICFLVDNPHKLGICNQTQNLKKIFASNIGRCFEVDADGQILYVDKSEPTEWKIKKYNPTTQTSALVQTLPKGSEDFALDDQHQLYCSQGSKILRSQHPGKWTIVINLEAYRILNIQRIAISKNSLALVNVP
jgi:hypothetical protein